MFWREYDIRDLGSVDISGANATTAVEVGEKWSIKRIIGVVTVATTGAAASVITMAIRDADGNGSADVGTFTVPSGVAVNTVFYVDPAKPDTDGTAAVDGTTLYTDDPDMPVVLPGEEFLLTSNGGGDAGTVRFFVQYQRGGFVPGSHPVTASEYAWVAA